jgi:hypothetical protein
VICNTRGAYPEWLRERNIPPMPDSRDSYDQFADASSTPIWDLLVGLATLATVVGGGLAAIYAAGYFMTDQASEAWPYVGTLSVLVAVTIAACCGRLAARGRF